MYLFLYMWLIMRKEKNKIAKKRQKLAKNGKKSEKTACCQLYCGILRVSEVLTQNCVSIELFDHTKSPEVRDSIHLYISLRKAKTKMEKSEKKRKNGQKQAKKAK